MVDSPELLQIDVVDISAEVLRASAWIYPEPGSDPLQDARVRAPVEDGRYFLAASPGGYDLISAEPPPPNAHAVAREFLRGVCKTEQDTIAVLDVQALLQLERDATERGAPGAPAH